MIFRLACLFAIVDAVEDAEAMLQTGKVGDNGNNKVVMGDSSLLQSKSSTMGEQAEEQLSGHLLALADNGLATTIDAAKVRTAMQLVEEGEQLSERLLALAENATDVTRNLLESLRICGQCEHFQRLGEPHDGGYLTCMDSQEKIVGALSLGVERHDQWTLDVHGKFGVKVGQFDCTVDSGTDCSGDCEFFKNCVGSADGHGNSAGLSPMVTLEQALVKMQFGAVAEGSLLMKMDIEGSEWPLFQVESPNVLKKFRQIIVEFHGLAETERHAQMLQAMTTLRAAGFAVVHLHGNNCRGDRYATGNYVTGNFQVPNVLEVTFLSDAALRQECASWEALPADAANDQSHAELQPAKLPSF